MCDLVNEYGSDGDASLPRQDGGVPAGQTTVIPSSAPPEGVIPKHDWWPALHRTGHPVQWTSSVSRMKDNEVDVLMFAFALASKHATQVLWLNGLRWMGVDMKLVVGL